MALKSLFQLWFVISDLFGIAFHCVRLCIYGRLGSYISRDAVYTLIIVTVQFKLRAMFRSCSLYDLLCNFHVTISQVGKYEGDINLTYSVGRSNS